AVGGELHVPSLLPSMPPVAGSALLVLAQLPAGDGAPVHLVGPVGEAEGAEAGVHAGQRKVVTDAGRAVRLDGPVDDPERGVRGRHLDGGDLDRGTLVADR